MCMRYSSNKNKTIFQREILPLMSKKPITYGKKKANRILTNNSHDSFISHQKLTKPKVLVPKNEGDSDLEWNASFEHSIEINETPSDTYSLNSIEYIEPVNASEQENECSSKQVSPTKKTKLFTKSRVKNMKSNGDKKKEQFSLFDNPKEDVMQINFALGNQNSSPSAPLKSLSLESQYSREHDSPTRKMPSLPSHHGRVTYGSNIRSFVGTCDNGSNFKSESQRYKDEGLESSSEDEQVCISLVKKSHELKQCGEMKRFYDEMAFINDGLSLHSSLTMQQSRYSPTLTLTLYSLLGLIKQLKNPDFLLKFRASDLVLPMFQLLRNHTDSIMRRLICLWLGYLCEDAKTTRNLEKHSLSNLILKYLKSPFESVRSHNKRELLYIKDMENLKPHSFNGIQIWPLVLLNSVLRHSNSLSRDLMDAVNISMKLFQSNKDVDLILDCLGTASAMSKEIVSILNQETEFINQMMKCFDENESREKKIIKILINLSSEEEFSFVISYVENSQVFLQRLVRFAIHSSSKDEEEEEVETKQDQGLSDLSILSIGLLLNLMQLSRPIQSQIGSLPICFECSSSTSCENHSTQSFCQHLSLELKTRLENEEQDGTPRLSTAYLTLLAASLIKACPLNRSEFQSTFSSFDQFIVIIQEFMEFQKKLNAMSTDTKKGMEEKSARLYKCFEGFIYELSKAN